jgi:hypothetical protein
MKRRHITTTSKYDKRKAAHKKQIISDQKKKTASA